MPSRPPPAPAAAGAARPAPSSSTSTRSSPGAKLSRTQARAPAPPCLSVLVRASCTSRYTASCTPAGTSGACPWISSVVSSPADRTCSISASSWPRSGTGCRASAAVLAGALAQDAEEPAGIGQRAAPGGRHAAHDVGGPFRRAGRRRDRRFAQGGHDGEVVGDDVVHLAGDPGAFGCRGERGLLVCLAFQPFGTVMQLGEVGAAGGDVQAEPESGGDHPGEEDRVKPPFAVHVQQQGGDRDDLEQAGADQRVPARPHRRHGIHGDEQGQAVDRASCPQSRGDGGEQDPAEHRDGPDPPDHQRRDRDDQHDDFRRGAAGCCREAARGWSSPGPAR